MLLTMAGSGLRLRCEAQVYSSGGKYCCVCAAILESDSLNTSISPQSHNLRKSTNEALSSLLPRHRHSICSTNGYFNAQMAATSYVCTNSCLQTPPSSFLATSTKHYPLKHILREGHGTVFTAVSSPSCSAPH